MTGFELKEARTELEVIKDRFYDFPEETGVSNSINNIQKAIGIERKNRCFDRKGRVNI